MDNRKLKAKAAVIFGQLALKQERNSQYKVQSLSMGFFNPNVKEVADKLLKAYPLVSEGRIASYPTYFVNEASPFLMVVENSIAVKVHKPMANLLKEIYEYKVFHPDWNLPGDYWMLVTKTNPEGYFDDEWIIRESILYNLRIVTSRSLLQ